jgi:TolB protein
MESGTTTPPAAPVPPAVDSAPKRSTGLLVGGVTLALVAAGVVGAVWVAPALTERAASPAPSGGIAASATGLATTAPGVVPSLAASNESPGPASSVSPGLPLASTGSIVVLGNDGSLSLVDATGRATILSPPGDVPVGFPVWSPDGSRIAAVRRGADSRILVYDAQRAGSGESVEPVVVFRSSDIGPFYLSWTPDGKDVSFLAEESDGLSLRIAPADGSAPLDGSGPSARIRSGNPFYFDWIGGDRLLAHVGAGPDAFVGEIGLDGASDAPALKSPGDFRSAVVSHDRAFVSYVRARADGSADVVVAARDGSGEHAMPVFGMAAMAFDPQGETIASIGPTQPLDTPFAIPIGPLRLIDPTSGNVRTLLEGSVVSFWWSPDGKTIAALRVQPAAGATSAVSPTSSSSPVPSPAPQATEIRILVVDVASGDVRTQRVVLPPELFIDQFLAYFDQYALSHRLWAPDSSSLLLPVVDRDGTTRIAVIFRNGDPPRAIDGAIAFWSP